MLIPAGELLGVDEETLNSAIDSLITDRQLESAMIDGKEFLFIPSAYRAERNAARRIKVLCSFPPAGKPTLLQDIENIEYSLSIKYEQKQKSAIITAVEKGVLTLHNGDGNTALNITPDADGETLLDGFFIQPVSECIAMIVAFIFYRRRFGRK